MWSEKHNKCRRCGTTKESHHAHGFCSICYAKVRRDLEDVKKAKRKALESRVRGVSRMKPTPEKPKSYKDYLKEAKKREKYYERTY